MSMLAEPRRKQKVINLRAKNNAWSNDSNKFGQRMLEKMGWSSGKGLGAKENGIVEHVVARYKNDEKGLGFEDKNDQWTKHEDDFNSLLANLSNAESNTEILHSGVSLEKKSKKSKARIHYHKFTRGKDLSRYSEKDLANIFGKKSFKQSEVEETLKEDTIKTTEQVFTEKGNMDDYFKTKMAAFKSKSKLLNTDIESKDSVSDYAFQGFSNTSEPEKGGEQNVFGYQPYSFYSSQNNGESQKVESCVDSDTKGKKKKKLKQKVKISQELVENNITDCSEKVTQNVVMDEQVITKTKVKKAKKKNGQKCIEEIEPSLEVEGNLVACSQETTEILTSDVKQTKVKKSKKKKHKECLSSIQVLEMKEKSECSQEVIEVEPSKKSKKKKIWDGDSEEVQTYEIIKKKKNKNLNCVEDIMIDAVPKKKRKNHVL